MNKSWKINYKSHNFNALHFPEKFSILINFTLLFHQLCQTLLLSTPLYLINACVICQDATIKK